MKIAILGGGFTGLTASYYLAKKGHSVVLFEKEHVLGGLASGFKSENWDWVLERAYHHLFYSDSDILNFANEIGFNDIFFQEPETSSLYKEQNPTSLKLRGASNYRTIPVDTPQDFLRFPLLSIPEKLRSAAVLGFLKFSPYFSFYEKQTAEKFLQKTMGNNVWNILWQELFRKKFGKYAEKVVASFIWARINKRTKKLGYVKGGFQNFIDYIAEKNKELEVEIRRGTAVDEITKTAATFTTNGEHFDKVISTLPTPALTRITRDLFPQTYINRLQKLHYLHAINLILETDNPFLEKTYWLNICTKGLPFMVVVQHSNFIDKQYYGGKHITYVARYVDLNDKLIKMSKEEVLNYWLPELKKITNHKSQITNSFLFKGPFAQPIFDKEFVKNKPDFETPVKNFFIANLDMTYPYDRGTNYAVKLGREVSRLL
jgi:protoporphyrinogen oxidase